MSIAVQWPLHCGLYCSTAKHISHHRTNCLFFFPPVWKVIFLFILSGDTQTQLGEADTYEEKSCNRQNICSLVNSGRPVKVEVKGRLWDLASVPLHSTPICPSVSHAGPAATQAYLLWYLQLLAGALSTCGGYQRNGSSVERCLCLCDKRIKQDGSDVSVWAWHPMWLIWV